MVAQSLHSRTARTFSLFDLLVAPLGLIVRGRTALIVYTILLSAIALGSARLLTDGSLILISQFIDPLSQLFGIIEVVSILLAAMLALPLLLLGNALPIKLAWTGGIPKPRDFAKLYARALPKAIPATLLLLAASFTLVGGLTALYFGLAPSIALSPGAFKYLFILGSVVLFLLILRLLLKLLVLPFLAITRELNIREALAASSLYLRDNYLLTSVILTSILLGVSLTNLFFHDMRFSLTEISNSELAVYVAILWYGLALFSVFSLMISENSASDQMSRLKSAASPIVINVAKAAQAKYDEILEDDPALTRKRRPTRALTPKDRELIFG